jgi:hypothetical protein
LIQLHNPLLLLLLAAAMWLCLCQLCLQSCNSSCLLL